MKTIKLKFFNKIPIYYTGIIEWENGCKEWYKNGVVHREDGPARIYESGFKQWCLKWVIVWDSVNKLDLTNQIILSKSQHPEYPTVQVWKILNKNEVYEFVVIPGMEEYIQE